MNADIKVDPSFSDGDVERSSAEHLSVTISGGGACVKIAQATCSVWEAVSTCGRWGTWLVS